MLTNKETGIADLECGNYYQGMQVDVKAGYKFKSRHPGMRVDVEAE